MGGWRRRGTYGIIVVGQGDLDGAVAGGDEGVEGGPALGELGAPGAVLGPGPVHKEHVGVGLALEVGSELGGHHSVPFV